MSGRPRPSILVNSAVNWLGYALRIVAVFFLTPQLIHGLGDQRYGIWSLVESVLAYLSLFDLGIAVSLVRFAARFEAQRDWRSLNRVFSTSLSLFTGIGAIVILITLCLALGPDRPLGAPAELAGEIRILLILLGANLAIGLPMSVYPTLFDGLGLYGLKIAIRTTWMLISTLLLIIVVHLGYGLIAVGVVITVCSQAELVTMAFAVRRHLPKLRFSPRLVDRETIRLIRGNSFFAFLALIAGRISFQTDALVIGGFLAPQFITFFMVAARIVEFSKDATRALTLPFTSAISAYEANDDDEGIRRSFLSGTRAIVWLTTPLQAGLVSLGYGFLLLWVGPHYATSSYPVLAILAIPLTLCSAQLVAGRVLYGLGRLHAYAVIVLVEAFINLLLSVVLVRSLGITGVALGTAIPNLVANILIIFIVCRIVNVEIRRYLLDTWLKPTVLGCVLFAAWIFLSRTISINSWYAFCGIGFLGTAGFTITALGFELGVNRMLQIAKGSIERARIIWIGLLKVAEN